MRINQSNAEVGKVYLVGAGPGDPDLLTVKALRLIQTCEVILYDNLVSEEIRALFPSGSKKFFVGKAKNKHSVSQEDLNRLMIRLANKGVSVCRLKGGDPFIFGRGSEEMLSLKAANIITEVVPGITAASGCTSYAGIPLTHRNVSQGCTFVTSHAENELSINWSSLATSNHTLVFYMGLTKLDTIQEKLIENGLSKNTPAALIENGSHKDQRVIVTELNQLSKEAHFNRLKSPTLIVIGEVVNYHQHLDWFETVSMDNKNVSLMA